MYPFKARPWGGALIVLAGFFSLFPLASGAGVYMEGLW